MKRVLAVLLTMVMIIGSFTIPVAAAADVGTLIASELFSFSTSDRTMSVELLDLFMQVDDPDGLANAYEAAFASLSASGKTRLENLGLSVAAMQGFANFLSDDLNQVSLVNMRKYLGLQGNSEDEAALAAAINARQSEFNAAMAAVGITDDTMLSTAISKMPTIFTFMRGMTMLKSKAFVYDTYTGTMRLDTAQATKIVEFGAGLLSGGINDTTSVVAAMAQMPVYYNAASQNDKTAMYKYLNDYDFLSFESSRPANNGGGGGGGNGNGNGNGRNRRKTVIIGDEGIARGAVALAADVLLDTVNGKSVVNAVYGMTNYWSTDKASVVGTRVIIVASEGTAGIVGNTFTIEHAVLQDMIAMGITRVYLSTDAGSYAFNPAAFESEIAQALAGRTNAEKASATITLSMVPVDANADYLAKLTSSQKARVALGSTVYDLGVSTGYTSTTGTAVTVDWTGADRFDGYVTVGLPYVQPVGEKTTLFRLTEDGVENMGGLYSTASSLFQTTLDHFSDYALADERETYSDLGEASWSQSYIEALRAAGIISGDGKGHFQPNGTVTRAEFAKMIVAAIKLPGSTVGANYADVKGTDWYAAFVQAASDAGIITGTDGKFKPGAKITRQEIAVILQRALELLDIAPDAEYDLVAATFADKAKTASWAQDGVAAAISTGILTGRTVDGKSYLDPTGNATRAEAAAMIYRFIEYVLAN